MSTAAISSSSIYQELQTFYQSRQSDLKQLGSALQSGDLNGAQQAYKALAALGQNGPFANSEPFSKSSRAQAFETIGQDLQTGDLAGAQAAFATLTSGQNNSATAAQSPADIVNLVSAQPTAAASPTTTSTSSIYQQLQAYRQQRSADVAQLGQDLQAGNLNAAQQDFNTLTALGQSGPNKNGQVFQQAGRDQDFQAIGQALQAGDLAGAQSAFTALASTFGQQNQKAIAGYNSGATEIVINLISPPTTTTGAPPTDKLPPSTINFRPVAVGPAPVVPPITPGRVPPSTVTQPPSTGTVSTGSGNGLPEIVINLNEASGAGGSAGSQTEIVLNLGQGAGTSSNSPEQITINLDNSSSGEQLSIDTTQGQNGNTNEQLTFNLNPQNNYEIILNLLSASASQTQNSTSNALSVQA